MGSRAPGANDGRDPAFQFWRLPGAWVRKSRTKLGIWQMNAGVRMIMVVIASFLGTYAYYRWVLVPTLHKEILHLFGVGLYWVVLAAPVVLIAPVFTLIAGRGSHRSHVLIGAFALLFASGIVGLAFYWDLLFCAFVTRGTCE